MCGPKKKTLEAQGRQAKDMDGESTRGGDERILVRHEVALATFSIMHFLRVCKNFPVHFLLAASWEQKSVCFSMFSQIGYNSAWTVQHMQSQKVGWLN